jgi:tripartite ATP-independent transporter DctM subunit
MEWLGIAMFAGALVFLSLGFPVAFSLGGVAMLFALIGTAVGEFSFSFFHAMPSRIFGIMSNYTLLAIPYFIFLGSMLEKTGIAEKLLETIGMLFGRVRGGLALAVVLVGALLAASTGVVAATVVAMGLISLPIMLRYGYNKELAAGVIVASGTLGQIIPPSVVLVVLGDQLGVPVGDLFVGSLIPGLMMAGAFAIHVLMVAYLKPEVAPALPASIRMSGKKLLARMGTVMLPPLLLIVIILGSIFIGIATPTEAGALGSVGTIILAAVNRQLTWAALREVCDAIIRITTMVMFILIGSTAFSLVFRGLGGDRFVQHLLVNIPGGTAGFLLINMLVIFLLGFSLISLKLPLLSFPSLLLSLNS